MPKKTETKELTSRMDEHLRRVADTFQEEDVEQGEKQANAPRLTEAEIESRYKAHLEKVNAGGR